jgi:hypothetical protein
VSFLYGWPYVALALGAPSLVLLLLKPRAPQWLVCWMLPVYMLHQFEEHGVDLLGRRFAFLADLCRTVGYPRVDDCPADAWFVLAVNVGAVWIAGALAIGFRRRNPSVGACALGIPLVNAFIHIGQAIVFCDYNAGLFTSVMLFLPVCIYALRTLRPPMLRVVACGALTHAVLIAGFFAHGLGLISWGLDLELQVLNGFWPLLLGSLPRHRPQAQANAAG